MKKNTTLAIVIICLFISTWLLYANTLGNKFAFDDKSIIVDSVFLKRGTTLSEIFTTNYRYAVGFHDEGLYRPIAILSYVINNRNFDPLPFHFINITINALNTILFYLLILRFFGSSPIALLSSVIFAFHPIHTESVANIAGRPELLCAFFLMLSWYVLISFKKNKWSIATACFLFLMSLLSKETAVIFPFMVIAVDCLRRKLDIKQIEWVRYTFLFVTLSIYFIIRWAVLGITATGKPPDFIDNSIYYSPFGERIATALYVFLKYLSLMFFPVHLSADYSFNQLTIYKSMFQLIPLLGLLIFSAIVFFPLVSRNRYRIFSIACVIFLFPYLLVSNIIFPIGTIMGERLMYLPSAGFALALGTILYRLYNKHTSTAIAITVSLILLFTIRTVTRNKDWYDDFAIFSAALKTSPKSAKVHTNLGFLHGLRGDKKTGEQYYRSALAIFPDYDAALSGLGKNLYDQLRFQESALMYERAVKVKPEDSIKYYDFGIVLSKLSRTDKAINIMSEAIRLSPASPVYRQGMGTIMIESEKYREAIDYYRQAMELGGEMQTSLNNMAYCAFSLENYSEALLYVKEAETHGIPLHPELVQAIREAIGEK